MATPIFRIFDYQQALEFYVDWLGFRIDWEERPARGPLYMQVSRGDIVLHLTGHHGDSCPGSKAMVEVKGLVAYHPYRGKKTTHSCGPNSKKPTGATKCCKLK